MLLIVEREITEQIDKLVQERVAECLKNIPQAVTRELKQVRLDSYVGFIYKLQLIILILQNLLESRRANADRRITGSKYDDQPAPSLATMLPPPPLQMQPQMQPQMHQPMRYYVSWNLFIIVNTDSHVSFLIYFL